MRQRGAHGLYLFNWGHLLWGFDRHTPPRGERFGTVWYDELHPCYYEVLNQIGDPETMGCKDALYKLESMPHENTEFSSGACERQWRAIDRIVLPVELSVGRHTLELAKQALDAIAIGAAVARRQHAGPSIERVDLQAAVVGQRRQACSDHRRAGLELGVLGEGSSGLLDLLGWIRQVIESDEPPLGSQNLKYRTPSTGGSSRRPGITTASTASRATYPSMSRRNCAPYSAEAEASSST